MPEDLRQEAPPEGMTVRDAGGAAQVAPTISVIICAFTEERWDDVVAAVKSVVRQDVAAHEIILVVDHNPDLFERLRAVMDGITVVENQQDRGLSGGKNTGVSLAAGDVVAFLDDDAVAEPGWIRYLGQAYADPDVIGVGGLTLPAWDTERPSWFPEEFDWVVGCTYTGRDPGPVRNLLGGNASFRREAFAIAGGFPVGIGRSAAIKRPLGCEETEFCIRLNQRSPGTVLLYHDGAVIRHRVPATRARFDYFRSRCYAEGLSKAMVTRLVGAGDGLSTERSYTTRTLRRGVRTGITDAARGDRAGLGRAGAIVAGLAWASAGYAMGITRGAVQDLRRKVTPSGAGT